jgi:hypothetical protein
MQASRRPRRSFAAPLVLITAVSAGAAAPGCLVTTKSSDPATKDHRKVEPTTDDHRGDTVPTSAGHNPPRPTGNTGDPMADGNAGNAPDDSPKAEPQGDPPMYQRDWSISLESDGSCLATLQIACKKGQTCNPPKPVATTCPTGITADGYMHVYAQSGSWDCYIVPAATKCPEKATCNPPPPKKTACPQ